MTWPGMCQFHGAMLGRVAEGGAGGNGAQRPVCLWHSLSSLFWSFCSNLARQAANNLGFNTSGGGKLHQLFKLLSMHQTSILHCFCLSDSENLLPGQQPIRLPQAIRPVSERVSLSFWSMPMPTSFTSSPLLTYVRLLSMYSLTTTF